MKSIDKFTNKIFNTKWEETLPLIPDNSVDIIITSPPYNVKLGDNKLKKDSYDSYEDNMPYEDYLAWMNSLFEECYRVLKTGGRIAINIGDGANGQMTTHADFTVNMKKTGFIPITTVVWDKGQVGNRFSWGSYQSPSQPSFPKPQEYIVIMAKETLHHEGDKKNITISAKEFQRNSLALWRFPPETRMMKLYGHPACVDDQTECLTIDGWKSYNQLKEGDLVASLDLETGLMEWQKNLYTTVYSHDGKSVNVHGRHLDMVLSPIHRCVVKKDKKYIIKMAKDLVPHDKIPCSSKWNNNMLYPEHLAQSIMFPNMNMAYLAGFFIGGGHYKKDENGKVYTIVIDQSETANHDKVQKVRECLSNLDAEFKENRRTKIHSYDKSMKSDFISFNIKGKIRDEIMFLCQYPMKKVPKLALHWDEKIIMSFVNGMVDADGLRRGDNLIIVQKNNSILNDFHAIGVRLGYDSYMSSYENKSGHINYVEFTHKKHKLLRNSKASLLLFDSYNGIMWCPYVEKNGTFVARRNGRVFITGNCFPEELPRRLIQQLTYADDIVLDPFSGAGTTCTVAKKLKRKYIGIEMSKKYYDTSLKRLGETPEMVETEDGRNVPDWML